MNAASIKALISNAIAILSWRLALLFVVMLIAGLLEGIGLSLLVPLLANLGVNSGEDNPLSQMILSALSATGIPNQVSWILAVQVGALLLQTMMVFIRTTIESDCQTRYTAALQRRVFSSVAHAGWPHLLTLKKASLLTCLTNEASRVSAAFYLLLQIANNTVFVLIYAAIALSAAWPMVAFILLFGLLIHGAIRPLSRASGRLGIRVSSVAEELHHRASEFFHNLKLLKASGSEDEAIAVFDKAVDDYRLTYRTASVHPALVYALQMASGYAMMGLGLWLAIEQWKLDPAATMVSVYIFLRLYVQATNLQQNRQGFLIAAAALPVLDDLCAKAQAASDRDTPGRQLAGNGPVRIEARDMSVAYGAHTALAQVSAIAPAGSVIGITGASGAGKSTFIDAVVGLMPAVTGDMLIDGLPVQELDPRAWRRSIGYVGQETLLFHGTIRDNLAWGAPEVSDAEIEEAARLAAAHDFIVKTHHGYDSVIGERGMRLSGGQRQRLGLARALVGSKRLLILDEATSSLDSHSEEQVLQAIDILRGRMTILMIAHRLSTLRRCESILVFDSGRLAERGAFDELIRSEGHFSHLWRLQSRTITNAQSNHDDHGSGHR